MNNITKAIISFINPSSPRKKDGTKDLRYNKNRWWNRNGKSRTK